jgi:hypothetical protein
MNRLRENFVSTCFNSDPFLLNDSLVYTIRPHWINVANYQQTSEAMYMDLIVLHQGVSIKLEISIDNWTQFFGWKGEKGERWLRRRMKGEKATGVVVSPPKHHLSPCFSFLQHCEVKLNQRNG